MMKQVFEIAPPSGSSFWVVLGAIMALMVALLVLFAWFGYSAYRVKFELSPASLSIRGAIAGSR